MLKPKVTNVAVPANGAFVAITLTFPQTSRAAIEEDPNLNAGVAQGLEGYYLDPAIASPLLMAQYAGLPAGQVVTAGGVLLNGAQVAQLTALGGLLSTEQYWPAAGAATGPAYQPIQLGDWLRIHAGFGEWIAAQGAGVLLLTSKSATPTGIVLAEWN